MKKLLMTKFKKLELLAMCIEGATGVAGASLILTEQHPYISIAVLALGAVATKCVNFLQMIDAEQQNSGD